MAGSYVLSGAMVSILESSRCCYKCCSRYGVAINIDTPNNRWCEYCLGYARKSNRKWTLYNYYDLSTLLYPICTGWNSTQEWWYCVNEWGLVFSLRILLSNDIPTNWLDLVRGRHACLFACTKWKCRHMMLLDTNKCLRARPIRNNGEWYFREAAMGDQNGLAVHQLICVVCSRVCIGSLVLFRSVSFSFAPFRFTSSRFINLNHMFYVAHNEFASSFSLLLLHLFHFVPTSLVHFTQH